MESEWKWYRADFVVEIDGKKYFPDSDYFMAKNDEEAIEHAKYVASLGWDYADVDRHVDGDVLTVYLLDEEKEFEAVEVIYY